MEPGAHVIGGSGAGVAWRLTPRSATEYGPDALLTPWGVVFSTSGAGAASLGVQPTSSTAVTSAVRLLPAEYTRAG